jgi:hypothetical protein
VPKHPQVLLGLRRLLSLPRLEREARSREGLLKSTEPLKGTGLELRRVREDPREGVGAPEPNRFGELPQRALKVAMANAVATDQQVLPSDLVLIAE